jgi:prepilin-type N-terminal cleavage/methylation domain-containing protein
MKLLKYRQMKHRLSSAPYRTGNEGFSLLEVLIATALVGLLLVVLLQILSTIFKTEEGIWKTSQALILAEKVLQENCELSGLAAGVFEGRKDDFEYLVKITPQYEVSSPMGELHISCSLIQVAVSWRGWHQKKMLVLETVRTAATKKP